MSVSYGFGKVHSPITKDAALSLWKVEGMTLPLNMISFYEQETHDECVTMIRWRPEKKPKVEGEL